MKKYILMICAWMCSVSVYAGEVNLNELNKKVEQLEKRLAILEKIIAEQNNENSENANTITADRKNWRKLKMGMSQDDIRKLLREPARISGGGLTIWTYSEGGSVMFDRDGVNSWREP